MFLIWYQGEERWREFGETKRKQGEGEEGQINEKTVEGGNWRNWKEKRSVGKKEIRGKEEGRGEGEKSQRQGAEEERRGG